MDYVNFAFQGQASLGGPAALTIFLCLVTAVFAVGALATDDAGRSYARLFAPGLSVFAGLTVLSVIYMARLDEAQDVADRVALTSAIEEVVPANRSELDESKLEDFINSANSWYLSDEAPSPLQLSSGVLSASIFDAGSEVALEFKSETND